jgi:hypothetical protein
MRVEKMKNIIEHPRFEETIRDFNLRVVGGSMKMNQFFDHIFHHSIPNLKRACFFKYFSDLSQKGTVVLTIEYDTNGRPARVTAPDRVENIEDKIQVETPEEKFVALAAKNISSAPGPSTAAARGIGAAIEIGSRTLEDLLTNSDELSKMPVKDRVELIFKAMRAQDARVNVAINARREVRAHQAFQNAFEEAAYQIEDLVEQNSLPEPVHE